MPLFPYAGQWPVACCRWLSCSHLWCFCDVSLFTALNLINLPGVTLVYVFSTLVSGVNSNLWQSHVACIHYEFTVVVCINSGVFKIGSHEEYICVGTWIWEYQQCVCSDYQLTSYMLGYGLPHRVTALGVRW